jgi:hypothetical protein
LVLLRKRRLGRLRLQQQLRLRRWLRLQFHSLLLISFIGFTLRPVPKGTGRIAVLRM